MKNFRFNNIDSCKNLVTRIIRLRQVITALILKSEPKEFSVQLQKLSKGTSDSFKIFRLAAANSFTRQAEDKGTPPADTIFLEILTQFQQSAPQKKRSAVTILVKPTRLDLASRAAA